MSELVEASMIGFYPLQSTRDGELFRWSEPAALICLPTQSRHNRVVIELVDVRPRDSPADPAVFVDETRFQPGAINYSTIQLSFSVDYKTDNIRLAWVCNPLRPSQSGSTDNRQLGLPILSIGLCCIGPWVVVLYGVTGAVVLAGWQHYRLYIIAAVTRKGLERNENAVPPRSTTPSFDHDSVHRWLFGYVGRVQSRVLLVSYGPSVLWGCNEPNLDSWPGVICSHGEVDARWRRSRKSNGLAAHHLGSLARFHGLLSRVFRVGFGQQEPLDRRLSPSA